MVTSQMKQEHEMKVDWLLDNTNLSCSEILIRMVMQKIQMDSIEARKISSAFGGGIAGLGEVCGIVLGGVLAIGLQFGRENETQSNDKVRKVTREFCQAFQKEYGYLRCSDLTFRLELNERYKKCRNMIKFATQRLLKLL